MPVHEVPHVSTRPDMSFFTKKEIQRGAEFILKSWLPYICTGWSIHLVVAYFVDAKLKVPMQYNLVILKCNPYFNGNIKLSVTRWTTM